MKMPIGVADTGAGQMTMEETIAGIAASGLPLQGKLDAFRTEFETKFAPPAVLAIMHRVTDELIASGQAQRALKAGDRAASQPGRLTR